MVTIHSALERLTDKRFDYTSRSDEDKDSTHAIGYCAGWDELTKDREARLLELHGKDWVEGIWRRDQERRLPFKTKYHTDGHATAAEAHACFEQYQLDNYFEITTDLETKKKCSDCGDWTHGRIGLRGPYAAGDEWPACQKHQSRNVLAKLRDAAHERRKASRQGAG